MALRLSLILGAVVLMKQGCAAPANDNSGSSKTVAASSGLDPEKDDLKTAASGGYPDRYSDWGRGYSSGYGGSAYGVDDRYAGYGGYDTNGYEDYGRSGYGRDYRGGYGSGYSGYGSGYGGYGGYGGNGGLNSYSGYNNPYYQGGNQLGYGYYRRPGYGNIYNNGITPSLVTGYRGYSRK